MTRLFSNHYNSNTGISLVGCGFPVESQPTSKEHRVRNKNWTSENMLTYLLTPWCRVLLGKLTGLQLVQELPRISRNPKVHYRTHKRSPPFSILGQPNPVHKPTSHLLEIHLRLGLPSGIFPSGFPTKTLYTPPSPHPYAPHAQPISFFSILSPAQFC